MVIEARQIPLSDLPSKGKNYPKSIEIYVKPITAREEMATSAGRFGITIAGYYENLLNAIEIKGDFDKNKLLYGDIQLIDLVRRMYSFELEEPIYLKDQVCQHLLDKPVIVEGVLTHLPCENKLDYSFKFNEIEFEDFTEEVLEGKELIFSDGLTIKVVPLTIETFIEKARKYLSNVTEGDSATADFTNDCTAASVISIDNREFESKESMKSYLFKYFSELYKYKDLRMLKSIGDIVSVGVKPIKTICSKCGKESEAYLEPSMRFHQE